MRRNWEAPLGAAPRFCTGIPDNNMITGTYNISREEMNLNITIYKKG
jgi:hypothetical protein